MEVLNQIFIRKFVDFNVPMTTITEEEFYNITRRGRRHLLLLDDLVLDATDYGAYHPGGQFIIERCRGTNIDRFFYGGYNMEPLTNGKNYNHSNYARLACNSLIIGKLIRSVRTSKVVIDAETSASQDNLIKTFKFVAAPGTMLSEQISKHYHLNMTGKHYLLQALKPDGSKVGNIRHYTISNCMAEDQYDEICFALETRTGTLVGKRSEAELMRHDINKTETRPVAIAHSESNYSERQSQIDEEANERKLDPALFSTARSTSLSLTIKAYYNVKGMSAHIFESSSKRDGTQWRLKGPMGKSLGVKPSGHHIAFAAGTGSITFMDLAAFVARFVMNDLPPEEKKQISDDFKFTFYVTYFNRQQACGLRLLEALDALGSPHFELKLRLSDQKSRRWDQGYLLENLPEKCEKLWVCGTPQMNESFEKAFHNLKGVFPYLGDLETTQMF